MFFFFQAEDGIRDWSVTGVQTCALPILGSSGPVITGADEVVIASWLTTLPCGSNFFSIVRLRPSESKPSEAKPIGFIWRSEERRVGKECRSRWSPYH